MKTSGLLACPECDALQRPATLPVGGTAECRRCGAELYRHRPGSLDRTLAWLLAAAFLFVFANAFPLMELDANGLTTSTTIFGTVRELHQAGMTSVALLVLATAIFFPALEILLFLYLLVPLRFRVVPEGLGYAFRAWREVREWGMVEVFLLGALVALAKLTQIAKVHPDWGLFAVGGFIAAFAAAEACFEPREMWSCVESLEPSPDAAAARPAP